MVAQPPFEHFGWAQRIIAALQFPKSAVGADVFARGFMYAFHMALFVAPDVGLYAVKLLPTVVATGAAIAVFAQTNDNAHNKNLDICFIFSLRINFNTKIQQ